MSKRNLILFIGVLLFISSNIIAQKQFIEGIIVYKIKISPSEDGSSTPLKILNGTLTIKQKGCNVIKELEIENGNVNRQLFKCNFHTSYSFYKIGDKLVALQNDSQKLKNNISRGAQSNIKKVKSDKNNIGQFIASKAIISNKDEVGVIEVYYTKEWEITSPYLYEHFSSFKYLALSYSFKLPKGSKIYAELSEIKEIPMNSSDFDIPKGCKIISQEEYNSWKE